MNSVMNMLIGLALEQFNVPPALHSLLRGIANASDDVTIGEVLVQCANPFNIPGVEAETIEDVLLLPVADLMPLFTEVAKGKYDVNSLLRLNTSRDQLDDTEHVFSLRE